RIERSPPNRELENDLVKLCFLLQAAVAAGTAAADATAPVAPASFADSTRPSRPRSPPPPEPLEGASPRMGPTMGRPPRMGSRMGPKMGPTMGRPSMRPSAVGGGTALAVGGGTASLASALLAMGLAFSESVVRPRRPPPPEGASPRMGPTMGRPPRIGSRMGPRMGPTIGRPSMRPSALGGGTALATGPSVGTGTANAPRERVPKAMTRAARECMFGGCSWSEETWSLRSNGGMEVVYMARTLNDGK
ncbi:hypothetical protein BD413DRAFT_645929, partial [Trametes elegans]